MKCNRLVTLFSLLAMASTVVTMAQTSLGIKVGTNLGYRSYSETVNDDRDESFRTGVLMGLVVQHDLSDLVSVVAEPMHIEKGMKSTVFLAGLTQVATSKTNYIEIPLSLKVQPLRVCSAHTSLLARPFHFSWQLAEKLKPQGKHGIMT